MGRDKVIESVKDRVKKKRIPCAACLQIAQEYNIPKRALGALLDEMGIKVIQCQLSTGAFP
jgi:cytidine deaminase